MPYQKIEDVNSSIRGIRPRVTLEQANEIAAMADAIVPENPDGAWAIAISNFKKNNVVRGGKWMKRKKRIGANELAQELYRGEGERHRIVSTVHEGKLWTRVELDDEPITEAATVKSLAQRLARDITLILAERTLPAALRKEIEDVRAALKRTWADLSDEADMDKPNETEAVVKPTIKENGDTTGIALQTPTWGAKSFADLDAAHNTQESIEEAYKRVSQLQTLVYNVLGDATVTNKPAAIKNIADEFVALITELMGEPTAPEGEMPPAESAPIETPTLQEGEVQFAESASGAALQLIEEAAPSDNGARAPVTVNFAMIQPGAGNQRDKRWYPADVLRRDAHVFEGADIFVTDHKDNERSERMKVGKVKAVSKFTSSGAPIAQAILFDPETAEKTRNRAASGELATLECSILGQGISKPGKIDGKEYNVVEALTRGIALELVSKAGAGGHALNISESEIMPKGGNVSDPKIETPAANTSEAATPPAPVTIQENQTPPAPPEPVFLAEADVKQTLAATNLPQVARDRLATTRYADDKQLREAITAEVDFVKKLTESGAPFGQGATQPVPTTVSEADHAARLDAIDRKYGLKR